MNFIYEKNIIFAEICKQRRKVALLLYRRSRGYLDIYAQLRRDYRGERRFAESGRTVEEHMIERITAPFASLYIYAQALLRLFLTDIFIERFRAQTALYIGILLAVVCGARHSLGNYGIFVFYIEFVYHVTLPHRL